MKLCTVCQTKKNLFDFHVSRRTKDGYNNLCKTCKSTSDKKYRDANKESLKVSSLKYRTDNKEAISTKKRETYRSATPKEVEERKHKKRERAKNYSEEIKQRKRDYDKQYFSSEAGKKVTALSAKKRRAQQLSSEDGTITYQSLDKLMLIQESKCKYCNTDLDLQPKGCVHLDHVIPLSKGGIHSINNVVWSCAMCNYKKNNKLYI